MSLFKKAVKVPDKELPPEPEPQPEQILPDSPMLIVRLVDGVHLDMALAWPQGCDIKPFAGVLAALNTANLIESQVAAAAIFASHTNQGEQAAIIKAVLESLVSGRKSKSEDEPLVPPTKVISNQMKLHGN